MSTLLTGLNSLCLFSLLLNRPVNFNRVWISVLISVGFHTYNTKSPLLFHPSSPLCQLGSFAPSLWSRSNEFTKNFLHHHLRTLTITPLNHFSRLHYTQTSNSFDISCKEAFHDIEMFKPCIMNQN